MQGSMLVIKTDRSFDVKQFDRPITLEELKAAVGGYIEIVPHFGNCVAFCNEEGKLNGLPFNPNATALWHMNSGITGDVLCGDVAILTGDAEFMEEL